MHVFKISNESNVMDSTTKYKKHYLKIVPNLQYNLKEVLNQSCLNF